MYEFSEFRLSLIYKITINNLRMNESWGVDICLIWEQFKLFEIFH